MLTKKLGLPIILLLAACVPSPRPTPSPLPSKPAKEAATPPSPFPTHTAIPAVRTDTAAPYPDAPLCATHNPTAYHTLWNSAEECHYDHEHGSMDFGQAAALLGVDLTTFTGGQQISYPWQTMHHDGCLENDCKHGGYKWTFKTTNEDPCIAAEVGPNGTDGYAVQFHGRGDAEDNLTRVHSSFIAVVVCNVQGQRGVLVTGGWQDYGQRVSTYQSGVVMALSDQPQPSFRALLSPYWSLDCYNDDGAQTDCGSRFIHSDVTAVSRPQAADLGHRVAQILIRSRDPYVWVNGSTRDDLNAQTFRWVCGVTGYNPVGCEGNNTTGTIHQVYGNVPSEWDSLDGVVDGLVTWQGYTDRWGNRVEGCSGSSLDCVPVYLRGVPVGGFSGTFDNEFPAFSQAALPERDIYFCGVVVCYEGGPGAVPSGWVSENN